MGALRHHAPVLVLLATVGLPVLGVAVIHEVGERLDAWGRREEDVAPRDVGLEEPVDAGDRSFEVVRPDRWQPSSGSDCSDSAGRRVCNGPRKVALPWGRAAALAEELGLGTTEAVLMLMRYGPPHEWVALVEGEPTDAFHWPAEGGKLWRGFGYVRREQRSMPHNGVDIGAPAGAHLLAAAQGLVGYSDNSQPGYGNMMLIVHAGGAVTLYAHCQANYAFAGQKVAPGDVIGEVGSTGIARGAHLHFEVRVKGVPRDPLPYLRKGLVELSLDAGVDAAVDAALHEEYDGGPGIDAGL